MNFRSSLNLFLFLHTFLLSFCLFFGFPDSFTLDYSVFLWNSADFRVDCRSCHKLILVLIFSLLIDFMLFMSFV